MASINDNGWDEFKAPMEVRRMLEAVYDATPGMTQGQHRLLVKVMFLDQQEAVGCYATPKKLATMLDMSERTVRRSLDALIQKGLIRETYKGHEVVWPFENFPPGINELGNHREQAVDCWSTRLGEYIRAFQRPRLTLQTGTDG